MTAEMLDRIVVLLLAMANLAERAAGAPDARRRTVLAILRRGGICASEAFSVSSNLATDGRVSPAVPAIYGGNTAEDAMALAVSLRFLALLVRSMAAPHLRLALLPAGGTRPACAPQDRRAVRRDFPFLRYHDTS